MAFFEKEFTEFFIELAANNHKDWFDLNRKRYETFVKDPFKNFVQHLITELSKIDKRFEELEPKDCIFRINRDIRFSQDKTPYKMYTGAVIAPGGKKSKAINGVYIELGPEHFRVYGGIYEIDKEDLLIVREGIAAEGDKFRKAYMSTSFKKVFGEILGDKNKIIPKELKKAAEKEPLIYNKQWYFYAEFEPETILKKEIDTIVIDCFKAGKPVEDFFNGLIKRN